MEVIKSGNVKEWSLEAECTGAGNDNNGCGATLLLKSDDIFFTESPWYNHKFNTFKCCECGVLTDLECDLPFEPNLTKDQWEEKNADESS